MPIVQTPLMATEGQNWVDEFVGHALALWLPNVALSNPQVLVSVQQLIVVCPAETTCGLYNIIYDLFLMTSSQVSAMDLAKELSSSQSLESQMPLCI